MSNDAVEAVTKNMNELNDALISRNVEELKKLTSEGLSYGHSKGKVENRDAFIANLTSEGATQFVKIDIEDQTVEIVGDNAIVRHTFKAETSKKGTSGSLEIKNMLVWQKNDNNWRLIARQAFSY